MKRLERLMELSFETRLGWFLARVTMGLLIGSVLCALLSSCGPDRRLARTPSRREIRQAMGYSSWEYSTKPEPTVYRPNN